MPIEKRLKWIREIALPYEGDACLLWPYSVRGGRPGEEGYPALTGTYGHIALCQRAHGEAPSPSHEVEHICGHRRCMNKRHVKWATHKANCARRTEHGTQTIGERHPGAKLSERDVAAIRAAPKGYGTGVTLAKQYGVSKSTISVVRSGKIWRHV